MKMKFVLLAMLLFIPTLAMAEEANAPRPFEIGWNVLTYNRQGSVNLYGGDLSFTANVKPKLGIVADVAISQRTVNSIDVTITQYRFGPKFMVKSGGRITAFT